MLTVKSLTVRPERVVCIVSVKRACLLTTPALAHKAAKAFPDLPRHACVNEKGPTFGHVMKRTPLPHLLEHLIIDLQLEQYARMERFACQNRPPLTGTTQWVNRSKGLARVEVSYWDDLVALRCVAQAADLLNDWLGEGRQP